MRSGSKWPMIGPRPCAYAFAYVDPVFTSQSYDISISTSTRRTKLSVFLVLLLLVMLTSTQFSLAYTCACAYAYASENQALHSLENVQNDVFSAFSNLLCFNWLCTHCNMFLVSTLPLLLNLRASSLERSGGRAGKGRRACNYVSGI